MIRIGTTSGMRGRFPYMYDEEGSIDTGLTCKNWNQCVHAAIGWAKAEFGDDWEYHCDVNYNSLIIKPKKKE